MEPIATLVVVVGCIWLLVFAALSVVALLAIVRALRKGHEIARVRLDAKGITIDLTPYSSSKGITRRQRRGQEKPSLLRRLRNFFRR